LLLIVTVVGILARLSSAPSLPKVIATRQLTHDGLPKSRLVSDGSRISAGGRADAEGRAVPIE